MTAAEILARHEALIAQITALEVERTALPRVARAWQKFGFDACCRPGLNGGHTATVLEENGRWKWQTTKTRWRHAKPNTKEGAKNCADAQLISDGVLLA